jgi:hypothetical protein
MDKDTALDVVETGIRSGDIDGKDVERLLSRLVNGMSRDGSFAEALMNDHPTLIGQIAKQVGLAVTRRCLYDPEWRPFDPIVKEGVPNCSIGRVDRPHVNHDGRIDCETFIGAALLAQQSFI